MIHKEMVNDITHILGGSPISETKLAGSVNRFLRESSDDRTIDSPIEGNNVPRTHGMHEQPDNTSVDKNLSSDCPLSGGVDFSIPGEKFSIPKADHARNDYLSVINFRVD